MKRTTFRSSVLPYLLLGPQLIITAIFFLWPTGQAVLQSFQREDAFGLSTKFVGLANYTRLFNDPSYLNSAEVTVVFVICVVCLSMGSALILAASLDRLIRGAKGYTTLLIWPYAVAPVVSGILFWFMFNSTTGIITYVLHCIGYNWNFFASSIDAMILVVIAASWKQVSYNFIFFLAGLQSIPNSLHEAAAIDRAGPFKRFFTITLPLLAPTTFFLMVMNMVYAMFDTFGIIESATHGGPAQATNILVFKVYQDGFIGLSLGSAAAQSVIMMVATIILTIIQFRYVERRIAY